MNHNREEEHAYHELEPVLYNSVDQIMPSSDSEVHIYDESDEPFAYETELFREAISMLYA